MGLDRYRIYYKKRIRKKTIEKSARDLLFPNTKMISNYKVNSQIDSNHYMLAIVGSDQVWHHWYNNPYELSFFYLQFMPPEKRVSYAASFGFDEFPVADKDQHILGLSGMRAISCREETGCQLVKNATGKPGTLVLDPTLCVGKRFWESVEERVTFVSSRPFMLVFMLGRSENYRTQIEAYAVEHDLAIIDLFDINNKDVWRVTIGGLLWLIHHAEVICTDSFHCTVFSILYEKPFLVFKRLQTGYETMYNRIETLLYLTGLEMRQYNGKSLEFSNIDFMYAKRRIEEARHESLEWLSNILHKVARE